MAAQHNDTATAARHRWTVLILASTVMMMGYIFWNIISPVSTTLKAPLTEGGLAWTSAEYGFYTSSYTIFNLFMLMLFFGGIILDKCGIRFTGTAATGAMLFGSIINYYAITLISPMVYVDLPFTFFGFIPQHIKIQVLVSALGFGIFGVGCDITGITISKIITKWFTGHELASAMGIQVALARLGTAIAFSFSPVIVQISGMNSLLKTGTTLLLFGFILFIVYCFMDKRLDVKCAPKQSHTENTNEDNAFHFSDLHNVLHNKGFWAIAFLCVLYYASIRTFMNFATDFMVNSYAVDKETAGWVVSSIPYGAIILSPLFGILYDRMSHSYRLMTVGCVILTVGLLLLNFPLLHSVWYALFLMMLIGIAFSLVPAALWPTVPRMVPLRQLGTAYSIIYYIQNLGLFIVPIWIGNVVDQYTFITGINYHIPMLIFTILSAAAIVMGLILQIWHNKSHN
ncbi:MAG: MFS transporter [Prevotella sp.]|jgi:MFS family permease|nr:MFS transporter [Prevotella sp.]